MFLRYQQVSRIIELVKPKTIVEVGTWNGDHALIMAKTALRHQTAVHYWGFDLFEGSSESIDIQEFNFRSHTKLEEVKEKLEKFQRSNKGFTFNLIKGNTRQTIRANINASWPDPKTQKEHILGEADLSYIDGGHSIETIQSDYNQLKNSKTIVLDDYYTPDENGNCPTTKKVGCNELLTNIDHFILPACDRLDSGGVIQMAATGKNFMRKLSLEQKKIEKSSQKFTRTVVTSFSPLGYYSYGKRFIEQFARFWPKQVKLIIYLEAPLPIKTTGQIETRMFSKICPEIIEFKARHMNNAKANGFVDGKTKNYRYDAVKFCHKVFALTHCALSNPSEKLYWIDADTIFFKPITNAFLNQILPKGYYTSYLGRRDKHSETGFMGFDLQHNSNIEFMEFWKNIYDQDMIFDLPEWHDCFVYDELRKYFEAKFAVKSFDIRKDYEDDHHPFINSPLGGFMDHLISDRRKEAGCSFASDLRTTRKELYWQLVPYMPEEFVVNKI